MIHLLQMKRPKRPWATIAMSAVAQQGADQIIEEKSVQQQRGQQHPPVKYWGGLSGSDVEHKLHKQRHSGSRIWMPKLTHPRPRKSGPVERWCCEMVVNWSCMTLIKLKYFRNTSEIRSVIDKKLSCWEVWNDTYVFFERERGRDQRYVFILENDQLVLLPKRMKAQKCGKISKWTKISNILFENSLQLPPPWQWFSHFDLGESGDWTVPVLYLEMMAWNYYG